MERARRTQEAEALAKAREDRASKRAALFDRTATECARRMCRAADERENVTSVRSTPVDEEVAYRLEELKFNSWLDVFRAFGAAGKVDVAQDCSACDVQFLKSIDYQLVYNEKQVQVASVEAYVQEFVLNNDRSDGLCSRLSSVVPSVTRTVREFSLHHVVKAYPVVFSALVGRRLSLEKNAPIEETLTELTKNASKDFKSFCLLFKKVLIFKYPLLRNEKCLENVVVRCLHPAVLEVVSPLFVRLHHESDLKIQRACRRICESESFDDELGEARYGGTPVDVSFLGTDWHVPPFEKLLLLSSALDHLSLGSPNGLDDLMPAFLRVLTELVGNSSKDVRLNADARLLEAFTSDASSKTQYAVVTLNAACAFLANLSE